MISQQTPGRLASTAKGKFARILRLRRRRSPGQRRRRLPDAERKSLGLQPGVGYGENDLTRARFYRALEQLIAREVRNAKLSPLMHIGFDGRAPTLVDEQHNPRRCPNAAHSRRNTSSSPLDYLHFQSKKPIEYWEWCVGKRFEYDFRRSRQDRALTVDYDKIEQACQSKRRGEPAPDGDRRLATFRPPLSRGQRHAPDVLEDTRLDAMARLGRLADEVSKISFWLLEQVVGYERTLSDVGRMLQTDQRYVAQRFREALTEAGLHYRLCSRAEP